MVRLSADRETKGRIVETHKGSMRQIALILLTLFAGCSSYSITAPDGKSTVSGSMLNGSASYSSGAACTPAVPSPVTPIPQQPTTALVPRMVCDSTGKNCQAMLIQADTTPQCFTQLAVVRGTDISSYFAWVFAALAASVVAVAAGS